MARMLVVPSLLLYLLLTLISTSTTMGQSTNATCIPGPYSWMLNVKQQSPCLVAAYLMGACQPDGQWMVVGIPSGNTTYGGPSANLSSSCSCSSVPYSLVSACASCQGASISQWNDWTKDCLISDISNGQYLHTIPAGTAVPGWALQPISNITGAWDPFAAEAYEILHPDTPLSSTASPTSSTTPSASDSSGPTPPVTKHSHTGALVGGAVGGALGLIVICFIIFFFWRSRRHPKNKAPSAVFLASSPTSPLPHGYNSHTEETEKPLSPSTTSPVSPLYPQLQPQLQPPYIVSNPAQMKIYNPDDPSTFPDAYKQYSTNTNGLDNGYGAPNTIVYTPHAHA